MLNTVVDEACFGDVNIYADIDQVINCLYGPNIGAQSRVH